VSNSNLTQDIKTEVDVSCAKVLSKPHQQHPQPTNLSVREPDTEGLEAACGEQSSSSNAGPGAAAPAPAPNRQAPGSYVVKPMREPARPKPTLPNLVKTRFDGIRVVWRRPTRVGSAAPASFDEFAP
jgi:hypothetical protein